MSSGRPDPTGRWAAGAVAQRLGIAPSTLRTWNHRYGVGPVQERAGRHRLYSEDDVAELELIQQAVTAGMPVKAAVEIVRRGVENGDTRPRPAQLLPAPIRTPGGIDAAAHRLDYAGLVRAFDAALKRHGAIYTWERLCRPALVRAGERVVEAGECQGVELVLTRAMMAALHRVPPPMQRRSRRLALLACMSADAHSLVLEVLAAALVEREVPTFCLGASVADAALLEALDRLHPRIVVLASTRPASARVEMLEAARDRADVVLAAGPGWGRRRIPDGVRWVEGLAPALEVALATSAAR